MGIEAFFRSLFNLTFSHLIKGNLLSAMCFLQWPPWVFSLHLGDVLSFEDPLSDQSPESFWLSQSSHYPTFNPSLCVTFLSFFSQHPFLLSLLIFYTWPLGGVTFPIIKQEANVEHFRLFSYKWNDRCVIADVWLCVMITITIIMIISDVRYWLFLPISRYCATPNFRYRYMRLWNEHIMADVYCDAPLDDDNFKVFQINKKNILVKIIIGSCVRAILLAASHDWNHSVWWHHQA